MSDHNIEEMSESEEMYLISIVRLVEKDIEEPIPIPQLAAELSIQPVSVNQMVHKLAEEGWVNYIPYKGVELSPCPFIPRTVRMEPFFVIVFFQITYKRKTFFHGVVILFNVSF